jgi:hypothetical protein
MRKSFWLVAVLMIGCTLPALAADDEKPKADPPEDKKKTEATDKVTSLGTLTGMLRSKGEGSKEAMSLRVSWTYLEAKPGAEKALLEKQRDILRRQQQIMRTRNPAQRYREMAELLQHVRQLARTEQNLFHIKEAHKDIDLEPADDMKVRTAFLPVVNDDKGYRKKYTAQEIRELRGKGDLPGYAAEPDALAANQMVTVYITMKKQSAKTGDTETKDPPAGESKPVVSMILIRSEPAAGK